jgi:hypothetical protein
LEFNLSVLLLVSFEGSVVGVPEGFSYQIRVLLLLDFEFTFYLSSGPAPFKGFLYKSIVGAPYSQEEEKLFSFIVRPLSRMSLLEVLVQRSPVFIYVFKFHFRKVLVSLPLDFLLVYQRNIVVPDH